VLQEGLSKEIIDFSSYGTPRFYEDAATASEEMLEEFMDTGSVSDDHIRNAISDSLLFPVMFGSALK
jgi:hypothetical protein